MSEPWMDCLEQSLNRIPSLEWRRSDAIAGYFENECEGLTCEIPVQQIKDGAIQSMICNLNDMGKDEAVLSLSILINELTKELYGNATSKEGV